MQANEYMRERNHIGSIWSRVTWFALPLAADQGLESQAPKDSQSLRRITIAIGNKQYKQINKQYTKQYLMTTQTVPTDVTRHYKHVSARIT